MSTTATAVIKNDIEATLLKTGSTIQSESAKLNYSTTLTDGTGSRQINYGVVASGILPSGGKQYFNFSGLEKVIFDLSLTVQFSKIKGIVVENRETVYGWDINIHATGSNALTEIFNGGSGNLLIKPYATYQYADPISGAIVDGSNRELTLEDVCGSGAEWRMVVVGVTG